MVIIAAFCILNQVPPKELGQFQMLQDKYKALNQSFQKLDIAAVRNWIAENASNDFFMHASGTVSMSATETLQMMKDEFLILKSVKASSMKLGNLSFHPDRISCTVKSHLDAITRDRRHLISDSLTVNTWKLVHKKWKLSAMVTTAQHSTVNGKPLGTPGR